MGLMVALAGLAAVVAGAAVARPAGGGERPPVHLPGAPRCPVFPANNPFNQRVDRLPVTRDSAALVARIGLGDRALRFTAPCTAARSVYPARHFASTCSGPSLPPMGLRIRLKRSVNISGLPYQARVVARALKRYGMILADNGSPWFISGAPNRHFNNDALHQFDRLTGRDFEVVDTRSLPHPGL